MRLLRTVSLATSLMVSTSLLPTMAGAQEDQVKLTSGMVENFITAHGDLAALATELAKKYGDRSDTPGDDPVASLPAFQDVAEAKARTSAILGKYGFKDLDSLETVTNSVMLAYQADVPDSAGSSQATPNAPSADPEVDKAKAKADIEADSSLTPDQKKDALQQLEEQYAALQDLTPLPGNADVVKPYLDKLKPIADAN